jgi:protocatechuate 3,4-dioxygenase beta subunit
MENDDAAVGRVLSRREAVAVLGATGVALVTGSSLLARQAEARLHGLSCVARPEQTEGPYFVDERLNRTDIRSDPGDGQIRPGSPLALTVLVSRLGGTECRPLEGAQVDLWQCDALGVYSDVQDPRFNTVGQKFLRGYQTTNARGEARFVTVYPGWYQGRTVHLHFKIRTEPAAQRGFEFTSQLYFDDAVTDRVHASTPYASKGQNRTRNSQDGIFRRGGDQLTLATTESGGTYSASFAIGLQLP